MMYDLYLKSYTIHLKWYNSMRYFLMVLLLATFTSCISDTDTEISNKDFFDIEEYMDNEIASADFKGYLKKVTLNGKSEEQQLDSLDLAADLRIFKSSNINKPSLYDKYNVDKSDTVATYTAIDEKENVRLMQVYYENEAVSKIYIERLAENPIYGTTQRLTYTPEGYNISFEQSTLLTKEQQAVIEVVFLK